MSDPVVCWQKCKMIVDSKGELPVAQPHVSDEEDEGKPFGSAALREQKAISFSINVRTCTHTRAGRGNDRIAIISTDIEIAIFLFKVPYVVYYSLNTQ